MYRIVDDSKITINRFGHQVCDLYPDKEFNEFEYTISNHASPEMDKGYKELLNSDSFWNLHDSGAIVKERGFLRDYVGEIHYMPINGETQAMLEPLVIFFLAERLGYKVVTYGTKNLFPYLSMISHKCVFMDGYAKREDLSANLSGSDGGGSICCDALWHDFPNSFIRWEFVQNFLGVGFYHLVNNVNSLWFWYDNNLVGEWAYSYNDLIRRSQYYPTTEDLVDFYKDRPISIFKSSWEDSHKIIDESPFFEDNKIYWFEHKMDDRNPTQSWNPGLEDTMVDYFGNDDVMLNTTCDSNKKFQDWILSGYGDSFLSFQLYMSIKKGIRFSAQAGSGRFFSQIPQINMFSWVGWEWDNKWIVPFKQRMNIELFGDPFYFDNKECNESSFVESYEKWLEVV
tara:strand:+ start:1104 stop:2297 length:1194 start_codon:yes stop_codon:yes gene_type:complete